MKGYYDYLRELNLIKTPCKCWACWCDRQSKWKLLVFAVAIHAFWICELYGSQPVCVRWSEWWFDLYPEIVSSIAVPYMLFKLLINK